MQIIKPNTNYGNYKWFSEAVLDWYVYEELSHRAGNLGIPIKKRKVKEPLHCTQSYTML
jgi:hypothetical protein